MLSPNTDCPSSTKQTGCELGCCSITNKTCVYATRYNVIITNVPWHFAMLKMAASCGLDSVLFHVSRFPPNSTTHNTCFFINVETQRMIYFARLYNWRIGQYFARMYNCSRLLFCLGYPLIVGGSRLTRPDNLPPPFLPVTCRVLSIVLRCWFLPQSSQMHVWC